MVGEQDSWIAKHGEKLIIFDDRCHQNDHCAPFTKFLQFHKDFSQLRRGILDVKIIHSKLPAVDFPSDLGGTDLWGRAEDEETEQNDCMG